MPDFTEREFEVLLLMLQGLDNEEIAESLIITQSTVKAHLSSIYKKLEVKTRVQAVIKCVKLYLQGKLNLDEIFELSFV